MSHSVEQLVETRLKVIDEATGPLSKAAERAGHLFSTLQEMAGIGAVVGGALSLHAAVESTEKYMKNLKEVSELTGSTVSQTDFLFSSARKAGVEYDTMAQTMFQLSRRGAMMESTMAAAGQHVPGMAKKFQRLGVDVTKGPVKSLEAMAIAVKKGQIGTSELMAQFRIPQRAANDMKEFLEKLDPKKLAAAKKGGGGLIGDTEMDAFKRIESAQHRINDAWNRIKVTVITKLYPIVADMAEKFAGKLEDALPKIQSAMKFVADHMDQIVSAAKVFVAVMTAKKMMGFADKLMGGHGLVVGGKALVENIAKAVPMLGKLGMSAGKAAMGGVMANANSLGLLGKVSPELLASVGGLAGSMAILAAVLAAVAVVVGIVYLGFKAFQKNLHGIGDRIALVWDRIKARFELMWETLSSIGDSIAGLFGEGGGLGDLIGYLAALSFDAVLEGFDFLVHVVQTAASMAGELGEMMVYLWKDVLADGWKEYVQDPFMESMRFIAKGVGKVVDFFVEQYNMIAKFWGGQALGKGGLNIDLGWLKAPIAMWEKHWNKTQAQTDKRVAHNRLMDSITETHGEDKKPPGNVMNFPNARFDITQNFAEGFDPDRIAVAFANDLSSLGEMRSSSPFAPIAAVR